MSAKWGVFGKSFNEIGQAIKGRINDVNNALAVTKDLSTSLKDSPSIWARLFPSKESIQSKLIDVDKMYPKIDPENFNFDKWINKLGDIDQKVKTGTISWQKYSNSLNENERWIAKWGQETEGQIRTQEQMIAGNKRLRQSALDHNAALKQQTLGAKAASAGMGMLKGVLNTLAVAAITTAVLTMANAIITKFTEIVNAYENGVKKIKDLSDEVKSLESEQSSLNDELKESKERLNELQQIKMPTLFEKSEIENLKEYNKQLEAQIRLKELELELKKKEANETAQKTFKDSQLDYVSIDDFTNEDFQLWEHILNFLSHGKYSFVRNSVQNATNWFKGNTWAQQEDYLNKAENSLKNYEAAEQAIENYKVITDNLNRYQELAANTEEITPEDIYNIFGEDILDKINVSFEDLTAFFEQLGSKEYADKYLLQLQDKSESAKNNFEEYSNNLTKRLSDWRIELGGLDPNDSDNTERIEQLNDVIARVEKLLHYDDETKTKNFLDVYDNAEYSDVVVQLEALAKEGKLTEDTFNNVKGIDKFKEALAEVGETDINYIIYSIIDQVQKSDSAFDNAAESAKNYADSISKIKNEVLKNSDLFNSAIEKQKNSESLSYDEVMGLVELDPSLASSFIKTADGYSVAIQTLIDADKKYVKENGIHEIEENLNQVTTDVANAKSKIVQLNNRKAEIQAIMLANKGNDHFNANAYNEELSNIEREINTLTGSIKEGEEAVAVYNLALAELGDNVADKISKSYVSIVSGVEAVTSKLETLGKVYIDVQDKENFDWSSILNNEDFKKLFGDYTEAYDEFIKTVTKSPDDIEACQEAFNKLVGEYVYGSGVLNDLTEDTREAAVAMLEQNGIVNAAEIVDAKLKQLAITREHEAEMTELQSKRSLEAKESYLSEIQMSQITAQALLQTVYEKIRFNKTEVKTVNDVDNLIALAKTAKATAGTLDYLNKMRDLTADGGFNQTLYDEGKRIANSSNGIRINSGYEAQAYEYYKKYSSYLRQLKEGFDLEFEIPEFKFDGTIFDTSKDSNSSKSTSAKTFNWIERAIEKVQKAFSRLGNIASNTYKALTTRNNALAGQIKIIGNEIELQQTAYAAYMAKANSIGLSSDLMKKVQNGAIDIRDYDSETAEIIDEYKEWYLKMPLYTVMCGGILFNC